MKVLPGVTFTIGPEVRESFKSLSLRHKILLIFFLAVGSSCMVLRLLWFWVSGKKDVWGAPGRQPVGLDVGSLPFLYCLRSMVTGIWKEDVCGPNR